MIINARMRMKKKIEICRKGAFTGILGVLLLNVHAQISVSGIPESFLSKALTKTAAVIPEKQLTAIDTAQLIDEDKSLGIDNRYGVVVPLNLDVKTDGLKSEISGSGYIWRLKITSAQCYSLGLHFNHFQLAKGCKVFLYNDQHTLLAGAFTQLNNNEEAQLQIAEFYGNHVIIEYFEPYGVSDTIKLTLDYASEAYKSIVKALAPEVRINCPAGANWQDVKHSVCRMTYNNGSSAYYCTGFLVNNLRENGTPYFQTANHCINTQPEASTLITYFNYENSGCTNNDASNRQTLSGAKLKATSNYSDFTLLLLNEVPPQEYLPYFAGWDASTRKAKNGTCIHHPSGQPKCISMGDSAPTSYPEQIIWTDDKGVTISTTAPNTHWSQKFTIGRTEGGSSGSPLFDDEQRAIGQLHGGSDTENYYGKFSLSWNFNTDSAKQLKYWLDPLKTGILSVEGTYIKIKPKAAIITENTHVCLPDTIVLYDKSKYFPKQWNWIISPSTYHFVDSTGSNSQNIALVFEQTGYYAVTLEATNDFGTNSITDTILADNIKLSFTKPSPDSVICGCNLINYPLHINGANAYDYALEHPEKINYTADQNHLYLTLNKEERKNGSFDTWVKTTAHLGSCTASDSLLLKIRMPVNDDMANAIHLQPGRNAGYSIFCASAQPKEPFPSLTDCFSSNSWCPDARQDTVLKHTIWFIFQAPSKGNISIDTHGFDDRIAVYDATDSTILLKGAFAGSILVGANDDRSADNANALLKDLSLVAGKDYWLQIDGKNNITGTCSIDLLSNSIEVFPNPFFDRAELIITNAEDGNADVSITSLQGGQIYHNTLNVTLENNHFELNMENNPPGMYLLTVNINGSKLTSKIILAK